MVPMSGCKCNDGCCAALSIVDSMRRSVSTVGVPFTALEASGGLTILGLLAIKNDQETFTSIFKHMLRIPKYYKDITPALIADTAQALRAKDVYGNTPMHYWAARGQERKNMMECLLRYGGCLRIQNNAGQSGFDIIGDKKLKCIADTDSIGVVIDTTTGAVDDVICFKPTSYVVDQESHEESVDDEESDSDDFAMKYRRPDDTSSRCRACNSFKATVECTECFKTLLCAGCIDYGCPACEPDDEELHEALKPKSLEAALLA